MFTFTGLETISSGCEEAREPSRTMPTAITYSVFITSIVYFCVSTAATLSLHYFPDNTLLVLPEVLQSLNVHGASTVISIGGLFGLLASAISVCFCIPRLIYALSSDKLLCRTFSWVSSSGRLTPLCAVVTGGVVAISAMFVKMGPLLQVVSIGTLLAYISVGVSVICIRYQPGSGEIGLSIEHEDIDEANFMQCTDFTYADFHLDASKNSRSKLSYKNNSAINRLKENKFSKGFSTEKSRLNNGFSRYNKSFSFDDKIRLDNALKQSEKYNYVKDSTYTRLDSVISSTSNGSISGLLRLPSDIALDPTEQTWRKAKIGLVLVILCSLSLCLVQKFLVEYVSSVWILVILFLFLGLHLAAVIMITRQPLNKTKFQFNTPYIPFIPILSIILNIFLLSALPIECWLRFLVWMTFGKYLSFVLYCNESRLTSKCRGQFQFPRTVLYMCGFHSFWVCVYFTEL